ncbi:transglutaminase-like domain-containing protein [Streptomyces sp. NBC_00239]|uniref:transglutaminase-like domain-containing protein n=1 Tax=Streptomyces sp. NBC_00239 TaxID=2903640 RepID=UPI002E28307A|nr:transglutaminase family protein [Streptomyces sp. NBC_00239]
MELIQEQPDVSAYLAADDAIDHGHPLVRRTAAALRAAVTPDPAGGADGGGSACARVYAEAAFDFVRDTIPHSADAGDPRVTWRASDVLALRTGICYAKSHALAALLRAEGIPTALCYQRLADDDGTNPVVHGLVAVLLPGRGAWARQDPRGNRPGVDARFALDREQLAFPVRPELGEVDYPVLHAAPHPAPLAALRQSPDRPALWKALPTALA